MDRPDESGSDDRCADLAHARHDTILRSGGLKEPVPPGVALAFRRQVVPANGAAAPRDRVGDHALHIGLVIDGELLIAWAEIEDAPRAARVAAPAPEHLASGERADEHEGVRLRDVEELA